jgi:WD repeat-containing protein 19
LITKQDQDAGNYELAHAVISEIIQQLEKVSINVPLHLRSTFVLLHSYERVKSLVEQGDHTNAARMLLRIAQDVSKFPQHKIKILCPAIIECHRAGLNVSAYEYASILMGPGNIEIRFQHL